MARSQVSGCADRIPTSEVLLSNAVPKSVELLFPSTSEVQLAVIEQYTSW